MAKLLNVHEVAAYLNIKERTVYDLVRKGSIPCSKVAGKWLFPQDLVEQWVSRGLQGPVGARPAPPPPVVAGSHDPLLEWALRESACGLALLPGGSLDGLRRLAAREALVCGMHVLDATGGYNAETLREALPGRSVVLIQWVWRSQGLVTAPGNPKGVTEAGHLLRSDVRFIAREPEAGTHLLLTHLLAEAGLQQATPPKPVLVARSQTDVGLAIVEGRGDAGLAVEAVARQLRLEFQPLHRERYDLAMERRDYFEPPFQRLLSFTRSSAFRERAAELGGYDIGGVGTVHYNGP